MVGSRAGGHQQHGGSGDQKVAGSSDSERCIDAERNAGDNGNACSENTCTAVDAPEPGHGPGIDRGNQSHGGRKSKAHQEACRRQHKDTKAGANDKVRYIEAEHDRQPERQRKLVSGTRHAPGHKLAGSVQAHALGCHAAQACPKDQAEQNDTERVDGMTEKEFAAGEQSRSS
jgi:hypothetical protein